jgi:hypothetical protein
VVEIIGLPVHPVAHADSNDHKKQCPELSATHKHYKLVRKSVVLTLNRAQLSENEKILINIDQENLNNIYTFDLLNNTLLHLDGGATRCIRMTV